MSHAQIEPERGREDDDEDELPIEAADLDAEDLDEEDLDESEDEDSEEEDSDSDESGESDGEEQPKKKKAKKVDDDSGDPATPVPPLPKVRAALGEAFDGEEITPDVLDVFAQHARMVLEGNRTQNLTAITDPKEMGAKHYLDCWRVTRLMPLFGKTVLDLGSGAGYPGIPIALGDPEARVTLIDSSEKRAAFLEKVVEELGLKNVTVVRDRAEEHLARNKYDVVLVRAVSSVRENVRLLRKVRHSLKDLVMLKGPSWSREVRAGEREAERLGFHLDTVWEHELPWEMGKRAFLVYRAPGGQGL